MGERLSKKEKMGGENLEKGEKMPAMASKKLLNETHKRRQARKDLMRRAGWNGEKKKNWQKKIKTSQRTYASSRGTWANQHSAKGEGNSMGGGGPPLKKENTKSAQEGKGVSLGSQSKGHQLELSCTSV